MVSAKELRLELLSTYAVDLFVEPVPSAAKGGVLVADHHPAVRRGLVRFLGLAGFEVVGAAEDGAEAVKLVAQLRPQLVTTCIRMPTMDGLAATALIRERSPETQVVVLTAYKDEAFRREARAAGAARYLVKSETTAQGLPDVLRSVMARER